MTTLNQSNMPESIDAVDIDKSSKWRFCGKFLHNTYKTHITILDIKKMLDKKVKNGYQIKVAHETADEEHPYLHTHLQIFCFKRIDKKNIHCFDISVPEYDIHPNIQFIKTGLHWFNTWKYLDKENCILDELTGKEFPLTNGDRTSLLKAEIQSKKTWYEVINDESITSQIPKMMNWAHEIFNNKPKIDYSKDIILRTWQLECVKMLEDQNDRNVLWIYDYTGGNGKSVLTNYLMDKEDAFMCNSGRLKDISLAYDNQKYVIFDLPRTIEEFTPYRAMEAFKDGRLFSSKYQSCMKRFAPAKVICFANFLPKLSAMSLDRWIIKSLDNLELTDWNRCRIETSSSEDETTYLPNCFEKRRNPQIQ